MGTIRWQHSYSVGDETFDDHHRQLIRYIQALEDPSVRKGSDAEFMQMMVDGLADYARYHFEAEETLMRALDYPGYEAHRREHEDFAKDITIFRGQWNRGSPRLQKALLGYLKDWLVAHILTTDKRLGEFLAEPRGPRKG